MRDGYGYNSILILVFCFIKNLINLYLCWLTNVRISSIPGVCWCHGYWYPWYNWYSLVVPQSYSSLCWEHTCCSRWVLLICNNSLLTPHLLLRASSCSHLSPSQLQHSWCWLPWQSGSLSWPPTGLWAPRWQISHYCVNTINPTNHKSYYTDSLIRVFK